MEAKFGNDPKLVESKSTVLPLNYFAILELSKIEMIWRRVIESNNYAGLGHRKVFKTF